jgi:hypothetical protein
MLAMCAVASPQHCHEAAAAKFHHIAAEDVGNWVRQGGVAFVDGPGMAGFVIAGSNMTINW